jgi:hypothetical protein
MSTISIAVKITKPSDKEDIRAMRHALAIHNSMNLTRDQAAIVVENNADLRTFYENHLSEHLGQFHQMYVTEAMKQLENDVSFKELRTFWANATPEQRKAAQDALAGVG